MPRLLGGPFDGATGLCGDPGVPSIWPRWGTTGHVWYRATPVAGRPRYDRVDAATYVFEGHTSTTDAERVMVTA